jgi:hypothetical protein
MNKRKEIDQDKNLIKEERELWYTTARKEQSEYQKMIDEMGDEKIRRNEK